MLNDPEMDITTPVEVPPSYDEMTVEWIHPSLIYDHPEHEPRFGVATVDEDFVASFREGGTLQPLIVTTRRTEGEHAGLFCLIAGRRRKLANLEAHGPDFKLPCFVKEYDSDEDEVFDLIVTNKHRKQSERQEVMQIEYASDTLSRRAKERQAQGLKGQVPPSWGNPHNEESGRVRSQIAKLFGVSEDRVRYLLAVWSDREREAFLGDLYDKFEEAKLKQPNRFQALDGEKLCESIETRWNEIRVQREADGCSLSKAAKMIAQLREEALAQVAPKKKGGEAKSKPPTFAFPARELGAEEIFSAYGFAELPGKESIEFGVIDHEGVCQGAAIRLRGRVVMLPWSKLFEAYVRPQLPVIPQSAPQSTPLERVIADGEVPQ